MLRAGSILGLSCLMFLRGESLCQLLDDEPCQYDEVSLTQDDITPWDTTIASDIAMLEQPRHGTWSWGSTTAQIAIQDAEVELPATATFVHDAQTIRYREHVSGGSGVACDGPTIAVDGTLTIRDERGAELFAMPITAEREQTRVPAYDASPFPDTVAVFADMIQPLVADGQISGSVRWADNGRFYAEFSYHTTTMTSPTSGQGSSSVIGDFASDP